MPGGVAWEVHHSKAVVAKGHRVPFRKFKIRGRRLLNFQPESSRRGHCTVVDGPVERMQPHRHRPLSENSGDAADMVEMRVREPDRRERRALGINGGEEAIGFFTGVDKDSLLCGLVNNEPAVLFDFANGDAANDHLLNLLPKRNAAEEPRAGR